MGNNNTVFLVRLYQHAAKEVVLDSSWMVKLDDGVVMVNWW